jgi:hypothetical protein
MFERSADEAQIDDKTRRSWRTKVKSLMTFVGHDDLARLTVADVIAWKDKLLKTKKKQSAKDKRAKKPEVCLDPKTVRNSYLAAVKATLGYAKQQTKIPKNVAAEVTVRVRKKKKQREKGFTEEEALAILKATHAPAPAGMSEEHAKARRWVPWICAYTGARVEAPLFVARAPRRYARRHPEHHSGACRRQGRLRLRRRLDRDRLSRDHEDPSLRDRRGG